MRMRQRGLSFALLVSAVCSGVRAQTPSPSSGEITVRVTQGLDSSTQQGGQLSQAVVIKSTNPAVSPKGMASLQLVPDPSSGGFSVQLIRLFLNGQLVRTASAGAVLAPDLLGNIRKHTRVQGAPQDAVSGARVFLPVDTLVRFTLTQPAAAIAIAPPHPVSRPTPPPPPPAPVTGRAGDFPAGPGLPVLHTERVPYDGCHWIPLVSRRFGFAILVMECAGPGSENMPKYTADDPAFINSYVDDQRLTAANPKAPHSATIEVFTKTAAQTLDTAVRAQILSTIKPRWRTSCHIKLSDGQTPGPGMQSYDFTTTTGPGLQVAKKADVGDALPCSPWEDTDSASNFYYKPSESRTTFFFSDTGQEPPNYEMNSIRFLPVAP